MARDGEWAFRRKEEEVRWEYGEKMDKGATPERCASERGGAGPGAEGEERD